MQAQLALLFLTAALAAAFFYSAVSDFLSFL
jgi:hypothetical protein